MNSFASIFGLGVTVRNVLYNRRALKSRALRGPVISIGNISVGGSGKTPFVIMLAELLVNRGVKCDVLSRGYGRKTKGVALVDPDGVAREYGDEPLLIARRSKVPVIVGEDRYEAGLFSEAKFGPQLHLLDDGFQHRALARDFDIVLLTAEDLHDRLLPSGRLREPIDSVRRADAIALMNGASSELLSLEKTLVWRADRGIQVNNVPSRPIAFCGIARPRLFVSQLIEAGVNPIAESFYRDHHAYTESDVNQLLELRDQNGASGFVTTEKDAINLGGYAAALEPLSVIPVTLKLLEEANAVDTMLHKIERRRHGA